MSLENGQSAPAFSGPATSGQMLSLKDFKGKWLVLYFYPKDNTPGCTQEGIDFGAHHKAFQKLNAAIIGISRDSVRCHESFKEKFDFPFELIADEDETICRAYGVMKEKNMYGKKSMGIERSTFLINPAGKIVQVWRKVRVAGHVETVLEALKAAS